MTGLLSIIVLLTFVRLSAQLDCSLEQRPELKLLKFNCTVAYYYTQCKIEHYYSSCVFKWELHTFSAGDVGMDHCHSNLIDRLEFVSATYKDDYSCNIEVSNATTADLGEWRMSLEDYGTGNWIVQVFNVTNVPTEEAVTVRPKHGPDQELPDLPVLRDCYLPDTSFRGHDVPYEGVRDAASAEQCQDYCIDSPECYFWKWNDPHSSPKSVGRVKGKCMLKTWTAVPGMRAQRGAVSGPKFCPGCFKFNTGYSYNHWMISSRNSRTSNIYYCQRRCQQTARCLVFAYNRRTNNCYLYLYGNGTEEEPDRNSIIGPKECPSAAWSTWSPWTGCNVHCGNGTRFRRRRCERSSPSDEVTDACGISNHTAEEDREIVPCEVVASQCNSTSIADPSSQLNAVVGSVATVSILAFVAVAFTVWRCRRRPLSANIETEMAKRTPTARCSLRAEQEGTCSIDQGEEIQAPETDADRYDNLDEDAESDGRYSPVEEWDYYTDN